MKSLKTTKTHLMITGGIFVVVWLGMLGCDLTAQKNAPAGGGNSTAENHSTQPAESTSAAMTDSFPVRLHQLSMTEKEFLALASKRNGQSRKIVFQFCLVNQSGAMLSLKGWAGRKNGRSAISGPEEHVANMWREDLDAFDTSFVLLGAQKLTKDDVNQIIDKLSAAGDQFVIFDPEYNLETKQVYFLVFVRPSLDKKQSLETRSPITTNPSPPASFEDDVVGNPER